MNRVRRIVLMSLLAAAMVSTGVCIASELRLRRVYPNPGDATPPTPVAVDPERLARGRHLAEAIALCSFCHGYNLGGRMMVDDPPIGRLWASNLTPGRGGIGPEYSDADLDRAIRGGVGRDSRSLLLMPSGYLRRLDDRDLGALIAYLRGLSPVDGERWPRRVGPLTRLVLVMGLAPELLAAERIEGDLPRRSAPRPAASAAYGEYLVAIGGCRVCHRDDLRGGRHPLSVAEEPTPPPLVGPGALPGWSEQDFFLSMRTGLRPDGRRLDLEFMPWYRFALMSDRELRAIWAYLEGQRLSGPESLLAARLPD
jgi:cytochrome c553